MWHAWNFCLYMLMSYMSCMKLLCLHMLMSHVMHKTFTSIHVSDMCYARNFHAYPIRRVVCPVSNCHNFHSFMYSFAQFPWIDEHQRKKSICTHSFIHTWLRVPPLHYMTLCAYLSHYGDVYMYVLHYARIFIYVVYHACIFIYVVYHACFSIYVVYHACISIHVMHSILCMLYIIWHIAHASSVLLCCARLSWCAVLYIGVWKLSIMYNRVIRAK